MTRLVGLEQCSSGRDGGGYQQGLGDSGVANRVGIRDGAVAYQIQPAYLG